MLIHPLSTIFGAMAVASPVVMQITFDLESQPTPAQLSREGGGAPTKNSAAKSRVRAATEPSKAAPRVRTPVEPSKAAPRVRTPVEPAEAALDELDPNFRAAVSADQLSKKLQSYYESTKSFRANFRQIYTRVALSRSFESSGSVTLKKPGKMRWAYRKPAEKLFVADGKRLVVFEPEEEQVIIDENFDSAELSRSISFLWGKGKLADSFEVALAGPDSHKLGTKDSVLELIPKDDATYARLLLVVNAETGQVKESVLHETSGNTNHFIFSEVEINKEIPDSDFAFAPPPGVEVIRR